MLHLLCLSLQVYFQLFARSLFAVAKMKIIQISLVFIILSVDQFVFSEKYKHIGDCLYDSWKYHFTFICEPIEREIKLFDKYGHAHCGHHVFWKSEIKSISFINCHQPIIPQSLFDVYSNLRVYNVSYVGLEHLKTEPFGGLIKLIASHNKIKQISADTFSNGNKLIEVDLSVNDINEIHPNAFADENQLEILNLSYNNINSSEWSVNIFHQLIKLKQLLISHNQIENIPSFLFLKNEKLIEIDFSFNQIKEIEDFAFAGDFELERLNISHNQLTNLNSKNMKYHTNLKELDISFNYINILEPDTFRNVENLELLDLSGNLIEDELYFLTRVNFIKLKQFIFGTESFI